MDREELLSPEEFLQLQMYHTEIPSEIEQHFLYASNYLDQRFPLQEMERNNILPGTQEQTNATNSGLLIFSESDALFFKPKDVTQRDIRIFINTFCNKVAVTKTFTVKKCIVSFNWGIFSRKKYTFAIQVCIFYERKNTLAAKTMNQMLFVTGLNSEKRRKLPQDLVEEYTQAKKVTQQYSVFDLDTFDINAKPLRQ